MIQLFETERLRLRPTDESDAAFILTLFHTPKWVQFIGKREVYTLEDAADYIREKMLRQLATHGFGNYTVIRKTDGAKLGTCGLFDRPGMDGIDIGFAFLPEFERQGYAFESAMYLKSISRTHFRLPFISGITTPDNLSSRRLLEKIGLRLVETKVIDETEMLVFR
jgi:[ribosomal protein S5]-alanine N-acetyltransferase